MKKIAIYTTSFVILTLVTILIFNFIIMPLYTRQGDEMQMPDVTLMPLDSAMLVLQEADLNPVLADSVYDNEIDKGRIMIQKPHPFSRVKRGRNVYLTISRGPQVNTLPDFRGMTIREARLQLQSLNLQEGWVSYKNNDKYPEGVIYEQRPEPGSGFTIGEKVNFFVSLGSQRENIRLPKFIGKTMVAARNKLLELKIRNIKIVYEKKDNLLPGTVIDQRPAPGTPIIEVKEVTLTISQ
ncbi:MAG: hypothetical protein Kow00108_15070 [Calditrichia bacterium]